MAKKEVMSEGNLMDTMLPCGVRLGDATDHQLAAAAAFYLRLAQVKGANPSNDDYSNVEATPLSAADVVKKAIAKAVAAGDAVIVNEDYSELSNAEQLEHSMKMALASFIADADKKRDRAQVEKAAKSRPVTAGDLDPTMIAQAFTRKPATSNA